MPTAFLLGLSFCLFLDLVRTGDLNLDEVVPQGTTLNTGAIGIKKVSNF